jgi:hypothetical protein
MQNTRLLTVLALAGLLALLVGACGDSGDNGSESPGQGSESALCSSLSQLDIAVNKAEDLGPNSTVDDARKALTDVRTAFDSVVNEAKNAKNAKVDDLQKAANDFTTAVNSLSSSQTLSQAASSLQTQAQKLDEAVATLRTQQNCP